ncbi:hypothetical protein ECTHROOPD_0466 [Escherichia coli ThroopD]|nr:hypothetical protein ECTHROOPD_0466 [Escherichia coli ThroopD]
MQNNGVTALFSLIGVCTQVSFVSSREGRVGVSVVYPNKFFIFVISDSEPPRESWRLNSLRKR